jgi:hypothetical protein
MEKHASRPTPAGEVSGGGRLPASWATPNTHEPIPAPSFASVTTDSCIEYKSWGSRSPGPSPAEIACLRLPDDCGNIPPARFHRNSVGDGGTGWVRHHRAPHRKPPASPVVKKRVCGDFNLCGLSPPVSPSCPLVHGNGLKLGLSAPRINPNRRVLEHVLVPLRFRTCTGRRQPPPTRTIKESGSSPQTSCRPR